jgi:hypothetical protein
MREKSETLHCQVGLGDSVLVTKVEFMMGRPGVGRDLLDVE